MNFQDEVNHISDDITSTYMTVHGILSTLVLKSAPSNGSEHVFCYNPF